jgi:hypothetical protein
MACLEADQQSAPNGSIVLVLLFLITLSKNFFPGHQTRRMETASVEAALLI